MATETNNLKLSKADSNDAIIQTLYANNNNLDIIDENISNLKTESDTKATKSELDNKADTSYVDEEVSKLNTAIATKADISYVDSKEFTLPVATANTLGGIKVGENLEISEDGTLRAIASGSGEIAECNIPKLVGTQESPIDFSQLLSTKAQAILSGYVTYQGTVTEIKQVSIATAGVPFVEMLVDYMWLREGQYMIAWKYPTGCGMFTVNNNNLLPYASKTVYATQAQVLTKTNTEEYTPTADYHPATKKYVDDIASSASGGECNVPKLVGTENNPITFAELPLDGSQVILSGYVLSNGQARSIKDITTEIMSESEEVEYMADFLSLNEILIDYSIIVNDDVAAGAVLLWKNITGTTLFQTQFDGQTGIISAGTATFAYATNDNVLTKTNTEQYTPTAYYHPATKKYVDDNKTSSLAASSITAGTLAGQVNANATEVANVGTAQVRNISAGTADLTAGTSALTTGEIYFVYE